MSAHLAIVPVPGGGWRIVGTDVNGRPANVALNATDLVELERSLEAAIVESTRHLIRDTREPRDDSESMREVERT